MGEVSFYQNVAPFKKKLFLSFNKSVTKAAFFKKRRSKLTRIKLEETLNMKRIAVFFLSLIQLNTFFCSKSATIFLNQEFLFFHFWGSTFKVFFSSKSDFIFKPATLSWSRAS